MVCVCVTVFSDFPDVLNRHLCFKGRELCYLSIKGAGWVLQCRFAIRTHRYSGGGLKGHVVLTGYLEHRFPTLGPGLPSVFTRLNVFIPALTYPRKARQGVVQDRRFKPGIEEQVKDHKSLMNSNSNHTWRSLIQEPRGSLVQEPQGVTGPRTQGVTGPGTESMQCSISRATSGACGGHKYIHQDQDTPLNLPAMLCG